MPNNEEFERAFRERFAHYKVEPKRGTTPGRPLQESGVSLGERAALQNLATTPQAKIDWLRKRGYEAMYTDPSGTQIAVRKAGTGPWKVIDERHATLRDILDIGDELLFGLAAGAGGAQAGPVGAGVGGAAAESVRQGLGAMAGFERTPGEVVGDVATAGVVGGATEAALLGAGKVARGLFGRGARPAAPSPAPREIPGQTIPGPGDTPAKLWAKQEYMGQRARPRAPEVIPGVGREAEALRKLRGEETMTWQEAAAQQRPLSGRALEDLGPPRPATSVPKVASEASEGSEVPFGSSGRTPGIRHTLAREEGGAIRETTEQLTPRPETVEPSISLGDAQKMGKTTFEEASRIIERAPKDAPVFVTFVKKGSKKEGPSVRTMRVHPNRAGPRWLSEGEVRKQTSKMPLQMLRELAEEHGPAPGVVKKLYGSKDPQKLNREGLSKWLFEKQPGTVTERAGPSPQTRKAENIRHQLEQFWEEFGEHTPGESAAKQARAHLKNLIEGRKESGGYRRFRDIVEVKVGDKVYRFDEGGTPLTSTAQAQKLAGKVGGKLVSAAGKTPTGRIAKRVYQAAKKAFPKTTEKAEAAARKGVEKLSERIPEETAKSASKALEGASETVKSSLRQIAETAAKRGRVAAEAAAYSLMRKHPELAAWAEEQEEKE